MEMLTYSFMQRALLAGILLSIASSIISFFIVLKRLAFIGTGIAHAAFGGVAVGLVTGLNPLLTAGITATATAWAIGWINKEGRLSEDISTGIFFTAAMALGILLLGFYPRYVDIFSYLFGNILAVSLSDLKFTAIINCFVLVFLAIFFQDLLAIVFDPETARATGKPVTPLYFGLLTAIALTVILSVKMVGIILASALLVTPAATAYQLARSYRQLLYLTLAVNFFSIIGGLFLSYYLNLPSGATIILLLTFFFLLAFLWAKVRLK
ncbi:MAG: zinc transport system permease protein [Clostridia bacterium]|nr:zinc transport system permease protein [Clostridia bacterium]